MKLRTVALWCERKSTPVWLKNTEWDLHVTVVSLVEASLSDCTPSCLGLTVAVIDLIAGNNHMKEENYTAAVDCYTQAIELDPNNAVYYCNR